MISGIGITITTHLIMGIEPLAGEQAVTQTQRHRGVVGPVAFFQTEVTATDHIGQGLKTAAGAKFQRGAQRITDGQAEQGAPAAVLSLMLHDVPGAMSRMRQWCWE